jgi:hypothetical protein
MSALFELKTAEGEVLTFTTEGERIEYVVSRMIERGELRLGKDLDGNLIVGLPDE